MPKKVESKPEKKAEKKAPVKEVAKKTKTASEKSKPIKKAKKASGVEIEVGPVEQEAGSRLRRPPPQGFEEDELTKFFKQFGDIQKIKVSRSKKTGRSKGYAHIQFANKEVAEIAASSIDGYMIFRKQLECHLVDRAHKETFKHGNREWKHIPTQLLFRNKVNEQAAKLTSEQRAARVKGLLEKEKEKRMRLKELGVDYEFPGYSGLI
eukprot:CAMPEP_0168615040 /NCGR_PEP_ID=MMETSP0449_2-20121227/4295_1 /TAXON_ID=1082188 /ORGANISM="Strombidium rassoulzadegani, Strain ras09" /LENGTH=207 /DNA_ID=CAMNT_0008655759 /DNA_START=12 /DNA_END=635 /DNA_ORIENTATION=-